MKHIYIALLAALTLSACASGAEPGAMSVGLSQHTIIEESSPLSNSIEVAEVIGGKKTNPAWTSEVSNEAFLEALKQSLQVHTMLSSGDARLKLNAELLELDQPLFGTSFTVTAVVHYTLTNVSTGEVIFDRNVTTPYTASFGDALYAAKRLRLANEGAIRKNIQRLMENLVTEAKKDPEKFGDKPELMMSQLRLF